MANLVAVQGKYANGDYRDIKGVAIGGNASDMALAVAQYVQAQVGGLWIPQPQALLRSILWTKDTINSGNLVLAANATIRLKAKTRAANDATMNIAIAAGATGITAAPTSADTTAGNVGTPQVETATAAGSITGSGNITATITAACLASSPYAVTVAVVNTDTAATWAGKVRTALAADATITAQFTVGGSTTAIVLTRISPAANDTTLNIALAATTATNASLPIATSANTTAGALPARQVETATCVGTCTSGGNITVTVTAAGMGGSPKAVTVTIATSDTPAMWAAKVRTALAADVSVGAWFYVDTDAFNSCISTGASAILGDDATSFLWAQLAAVSDQPFTITIAQSPVNDFSDLDRLLITQSQATLQNGDYRYLDKVLLANQYVKGFFSNTGTATQAYMNAQFSLGGVLQ